MLGRSECIQCHPTCQTCSGVSETECTTCVDSLVLRFGTCIPQCDETTQIYNISIKSCSFIASTAQEGILGFEITPVANQEGYVRLDRAIPLSVQIDYPGSGTLIIEWKINHPRLSVGDNDKLFGGKRDSPQVVLYPYVFDELNAQDPNKPNLDFFMTSLQIQVKVSSPTLTRSKIYYYLLREANSITSVRVNSPVGILPGVMPNLEVTASRPGFYIQVELVNPVTQRSAVIVNLQYSISDSVAFFDSPIPYVSSWIQETTSDLRYLILRFTMVDEFGYESKYSVAYNPRDLVIDNSAMNMGNTTIKDQLLNLNDAGPVYPNIPWTNLTNLMSQLILSGDTAYYTYLGCLSAFSNNFTRPFVKEGLCLSNYHCSDRGVCFSGTLCSLPRLLHL